MIILDKVYINISSVYKHFQAKREDCLKILITALKLGSSFSKYKFELQDKLFLFFVASLSDERLKCKPNS